MILEEKRMENTNIKKNSVYFKTVFQNKIIFYHLKNI